MHKLTGVLIGAITPVNFAPINSTRRAYVGTDAKEMTSFRRWPGRKNAKR